MNSEIVLTVNGVEYRGWKEVTVTQSITSIAGAFKFTSSDLQLEELSQWGIKIGDPCTGKTISTRIGPSGKTQVVSSLLFTGYIEDFKISYSATHHNIVIGGRDKTGDLVDCSFPGKSSEWIGEGASVGRIILDLCRPYDIDVTQDSSVSGQTKKVLGKFRYEEGDKVFETISKLCRRQGILPLSLGDGKLTLTEGGTRRASDSLVLGGNILTGNAVFSNKSRYKEYIVKGHGALFTSQLLNQATEPTNRAEDLSVERNRTLTILADYVNTTASTGERAEWEMRTRAGRSRKITYTVAGIVQGDGTAFPINGLVHVLDKFVGMDKELLITDLVFNSSNIKQTTTLTVMEPEAYLLLNRPAKEPVTAVDRETGRVV